MTRGKEVQSEKGIGKAGNGTSKADKKGLTKAAAIQHLQSLERSD